MPQPFLLVIAGPNGSGKTTLTAHLRKHGIDFGYYINPDDFAASLEGSPEERSHRAQAKADEEREVCLVTFTSFSFETVMSHPSKVDVMRRARSLGFHVTLFFVGVEEPTINIARVAQRVAQGGHDVPRDRIVARYHRTMALLPDAVVAADRSVIFDNTAPSASFIGSIAIDVGLMSTSSPLTPILEARSGAKIALTAHASPLPIWADSFLVQPLRQRGLWP